MNDVERFFASMSWLHKELCRPTRTEQREEKASECVNIAASLGLTEDEMKRAKVEALQNINLFVFGEEKP
jgi:hypothetical protein